MREIKPGMNGADLRIAVVRGRFNEPIGAGLLAACLERLAALGVLPGRITLASVPGALEIPLALQKLAATGHYDALIALGAVVRGDTYHFEVVSNESAAGDHAGAARRRGAGRQRHAYHRYRRAGAGARAAEGRGLRRRGGGDGQSGAGNQE